MGLWARITRRQPPVPLMYLRSTSSYLLPLLLLLQTRPLLPLQLPYLLPSSPLEHPPSILLLRRGLKNRIRNLPSPSLEIQILSQHSPAILELAHHQLLEGTCQFKCKTRSRSSLHRLVRILLLAKVRSQCLVEAQRSQIMLGHPLV